MKKFRAWLLNNVAPLAGRVVLRLLMLTVRVRVINRKHQDWQHAHPEKSGIYCFWHGNLFIPYHKYRNRGVYIVISQHRDGEIISRVVEKGGYRPVRGSSTRGGMRAMKELLTVIEKGAVIAFTPDGPRGPLHQFKDGPIYLAQTTGAPLHLIGVGFSNCWIMRDWSRLKIPRPFSTVAIFISQSYEVPRELSDEEFEQWKEKLNRALNETDAEAERVAKLKKWSE
jgi:hypothetical protein